MKNEVSHYAKGKLDGYMDVYQAFGGMMHMIEEPVEDGSEEDAIRKEIHDDYVGLLDNLDRMMGHMETLIEFSQHLDA